MTNNAERELLPCPFCGGNARRIPVRNENWEVQCMKCGAHTRICIYEQLATSAWQARAQASGVPDEAAEPRFFMSHGMIHDRVTGMHVTCDRDEEDIDMGGYSVTVRHPDGISATLKLLNELHGQARAQASGVLARLKVSRWVSDDLSFHFEIPFTSTLSTACDVERGDGSEQAEFLRALATALLSAIPTPPKSASVPVERLEALQRYSEDWVSADELDQLIAEYK